jgi:hypothetical protein
VDAPGDGCHQSGSKPRHFARRHHDCVSAKPDPTLERNSTSNGTAMFGADVAFATITVAVNDRCERVGTGARLPDCGGRRCSPRRRRRLGDRSRDRRRRGVARARRGGVFGALGRRVARASSLAIGPTAGARVARPREAVRCVDYLDELDAVVPKDSLVVRGKSAPRVHPARSRLDSSGSGWRGLSGRCVCRQDWHSG